MKTNSLLALLLRALATSRSRLALGALLGLSAALLTSCAGGYVGSDGGYPSGYYDNSDYGDSGLDLSIFGGGYDRGNDARYYSRRGSYSRGSSYHGGGGGRSHSNGGGGHSGGHSGGSHGGRR